MKVFVTVFLLIAGSFIVNDVHAQVHVNVNVNVGAQPNWGPAGYDNVDYYYLPDIETYYYVPRHMFVYYNGGQWVYSSILPPRYHDYDLYRGYKVVINEPKPYLHHDRYRTQYVRYREYYDHQPVLREHGYNRDEYHERRDEHDEHGPGNGHGQGHAYGHDKKDHDDKGKGNH